MLSTIPIFYLLMFKLLMGVGNQLDGLMRRFLLTGPRSGEDRGMAPVSCEVVCRPIKQGGLRALHLETINSVLLSKWAAKIMSSVEELALKVLRDSYGTRQDGEVCTAPM